MLQIKHIKKQYITGDLVQTALDDVSLNFRDNEFVAILGPSGSGKTTLLNIIGGLDRYDDGDLIINGISTKQYKDKDWDSYRNHTIGFVFQSYNLIPHQTVLANVELALTISGISKSERRKRAKAALEQVGLGQQMHKKPNQMSGGQMQRVAIARALVNNPAILLADEPTGALDSDTSVQVMDMLQEVAKDRLVIMVTHNPELAEQYATRIVRVKDGHIIEDSSPVTEIKEEPARHENMGKSSMSLLTSMGLSFNNLRTKKGRTLLTAFAGSIGIIGIALILSLSNGVNQYIDDLQKDTMTSYPISIDAQSMDFASLMLSGRSKTEEKMHEEADHGLDGIYSDGSNLEMASSFQTSIKKNNLTDFKKYLDDKNSEIHQYIGENGIVYNYDTKFSVFTYDPENVLVNTDGSTLSENNNYMVNMMLMTNFTSNIPTSSNNFEQIMPGTDGALFSPTITDNYDLLYGSMPNAYNELVLVLDKQNEIPLTVIYQLGLLPSADYKDLIKQLQDGDDVKLDSQKFSYADICRKDFYLVPVCDMYEKQEDGLFGLIDTKEPDFDKILENALKLRVTGIIRLKSNVDNPLINSAVGYTSALTEYLIDYTEKSDIVKAQEKQEDTNVLTGMHFDIKNDEKKIEDAKSYIADLGISEKASLYQSIMMMEQFSGKKPQTEEETTEETSSKSLAMDLHQNQHQLSLGINPIFSGGILTLSDIPESTEITETETEELSEETEEITESDFTEEPSEETSEEETEFTDSTESTEETTEFTEETTEPTEPESTEETSEAPTEAVTDPSEPSGTEPLPTETSFPDSITPEMIEEFLNRQKEKAQSEIDAFQEEAQKQWDSAVESVKNAAVDFSEKLISAIAKEMAEAVTKNMTGGGSSGLDLSALTGMSQDDLMSAYASMLGGSGMSQSDLMNMYASMMGGGTSGMSDLMSLMGGNSGSSSDLMNMYASMMGGGTSGTSGTDLMSMYASMLNGAGGTSAGTGGASAQDLMAAYAASSGMSTDDLMKMAAGTTGTSQQDLLSAYAAQTGMSTDDLMKMYNASTEASGSGIDMSSPQSLMNAYASSMGMSPDEMMQAYASSMGMSQEDIQKMLSLSDKSETELAAMLDEYMLNPDDDILLNIYDMYISSGTYDDNMAAFGMVSLDAPSSINIYVDSFEDKEAIADCIAKYNETVSEENQISYTDYVGLLMSSVTTIVNVISYVLIAFVAVSLVVSSIMIGIITYISVLERTKEIGILRAIGASKQNISQVFNAETFIIGLCSGLLGVLITQLLLIPSNAVIHALTETTTVNAFLPAVSALILVIISIILTLIGGFIPAKKAATKDPVTALRTD